MSWVERVRNEIAASERTWSGVLFLSLQGRNLIADSAIQTVRRVRNADFAALKSAVRTRFLVSAFDDEVSRWLGRIRKESGAPLRYLRVAVGCLPRDMAAPLLDTQLQPLQFRVVLHDHSGAVCTRLLGDQWDIGGSCLSLVRKPGNAAALEVAKYIAESAPRFVKTSAAYGRLTAGKAEAMFSQGESAGTATKGAEK